MLQRLKHIDSNTGNKKPLPSALQNILNRITEMKSIGYNGNFRNHPIYSEIVIDEECKLQFFDVVKKSHIPYVKVNLWGHELLIDTVEEIIAKKIYYRANKGNSRDLFDIAIAFHNEPDILTRTLLKKDKVITLFETVGEVTKIHTLFCLSLSHHFTL